MLIAPSVLLLELTLAYALIPWSCETPSRGMAVHLLIGGALLTTLIMTAFAWRRLQTYQAAHRSFLEQLSVAMGALVSLVIAVQWLTTSILPRCVSAL